MEAIELGLNFINISQRLVNGGFHIPEPRVAMRGSPGSLSSSGWTSSLTGPMLPLNCTPAALASLQVVAKFKQFVLLFTNNGKN